MLASDELTVMEKLPLDPNERATYLFKTGDGALGMLQLIAVTDDKKGIRVRYKRIVSVLATRANK